MAARKGKKNVSLHSRVLAWVKEFDGVTVNEVADEFGISDVEAQGILVDLSNDDVIDIAKGLWTATKAEEMTEAQRRLAYAANVAESQDGDMQHAKPRVIPPDVKPQNKAKTPVKAADGTTVTVPVREGSKERRELDASKGERLIGEDTYTVRTVISQPDKGLRQYRDEETGDIVYESSILRNGLWLDEPASIPERPAGVNINTWDMAHTAVTQSARDWWMARAKEQAAEYAKAA